MHALFIIKLPTLDWHVFDGSSVKIALLSKTFIHTHEILHANVLKVQKFKDVFIFILICYDYLPSQTNFLSDGIADILTDRYFN